MEKVAPERSTEIKMTAAEDLGNGLKNRKKTDREIGGANVADKKALGWAGTVLAVADLLWIPQAALIAWPLGQVLLRISGNGTATGPDSLSWVLLTSVVGIVMIAAVRVSLQTRANRWARLAARNIQKTARRELLRAAAERSPAESFPSSGAFAAHVSDQVALLGPYYRNYQPQLMRLKLVPLGIVCVTAWFSWMAALILLVSGPVIPVFMALIGSRAKAASAGQQEELTRLSGMLLDRIRGLETLVLFGAVDRTRSEIRKAGEDFRVGTMRVLKVAFLSSTVLELFSALGIAFSAVYVGFSLLGDLQVGVWGTPLGYSQGLFILLLAPEFFTPLRSFSAAYHDRAAGLAAHQKLSEILATIKPGQGTVSAGENKAHGQCFEERLNSAPRICLKNVSLDLAGNRIFSRFNLRIEPGETLVISGRSGCGKTTLLDFVLGFRAPDDGKVLINDQASDGITGQLRKKVMYLGQSPRLFHGSVKANLLKGIAAPGEVEEAEILGALRLAGAEMLVNRLPKGLSTQLGEDGFGLSVGEIRRIALARAALRKDAVILVADEPTAGLDQVTAADVIEGLKELSQGRTSLIATHDPALLALPARQLDLVSCSDLMQPESVG